MKQSRPALSDGAEQAPQDQIRELIETNQSLQEQIRRSSEEHAKVSKQLAEVQLASQTDRQARRAALNLMEDAVRARAAEQQENEKRRQVEEELRNANRQKDEFLAILAHELRNPLAPIRNSVQILRLAETGTVATDEVYAMLDRQVNHMVRLVDDLMEVSRITRGRIELHEQRVDLSDVMRNAVEISRSIIQEAGHHLEVSLPAEPLVLVGDSVRLTQVFANLLNNAAKYTPQGGRISLAVQRQSAEAVVTVSDNGIGLPAEILPRVFDLFVQGDRPQNRFPGGLGIGLTIARRLIELHGGEISVHSPGPGRGTEFLVRVPLAPAQSSQPNGDSQSDSLANVTHRRVLVVDDNQDAAKSLAMLLSHLGSEVSVAHDGKTALLALESYRPEMLLLDIGMPEMDGYEVARRVRQSSAGRDVVLIALTGWGQVEDRRRSEDAGFDHHLVKPVGIRELQGLLNSPTQRPANCA